MSNETKKYELVKSESIVHNGRTLYRIRALREFTISRGVAIKVGDIGGFVESENNLSQEDICWIFDDQSTGNCLTRKEKKHQYRQFWAIITAWLRQSQITI